MFVFGHLGIGSKLVSPWSTGLPKKWLLVGTLLPDLIDKPLYYALVLATGHRGAALGLISGTRTFGHTALFLVFLTVLAAERRSRVLAALSLGVATHLILDGVAETFMAGAHTAAHPAGGFIVALAFPLLGFRFPVSNFAGVGEQLSTVFSPFLFGAEVAGACLLAWDFWKSRHAAEILAGIRDRRTERRHARSRRRINS